MLKHSAIYAIANIFRQLVGFVMLPVYTSYLSPSDYGVVGLLVFLVSLFELLLGGQMFQAIPKFYHKYDQPTQKNSVITTSLSVTTGFSLVACLLMALSATPLSQIVFGTEEYSLYVMVFSILILTNSIEQYGLIYIRIIKEPWIFFTFSIIKLALQLGLNVTTIVVLDWGLFGLAISSLLSSAITASILLIYMLVNTGFSFSLETAKKLLIFSWPLWLSGIIGLYIGSSNRYFIRIFSSLDDVGLFELASRFGMIITALIWVPFSQYWQTERFEIIKKDNPVPQFNFAFKLITFLMSLASIGLICFSETVIKLIASAEFHDAAYGVPYVVLANLFQALIIFRNFSFIHSGRTIELTINNLLTAIIVTICYVLIIPQYGYVGATIAILLSTACQYMIVTYRGKKVHDIQVGHRPLIVSIAVLGTVIMFTSFVTVESLVTEFLLHSLIAIAAILALYLGLFDHSDQKTHISVAKSYFSSRLVSVRKRLL
ncbi:MAG: oligosaccharide flippase family protein [Reinekea sp.]